MKQNIFLASNLAQIGNVVTVAMYPTEAESAGEYKSKEI